MIVIYMHICLYDIRSEYSFCTDVSGIVDVMLFVTIPVGALSISFIFCTYLNHVYRKKWVHRFRTEIRADLVGNYNHG